MYKRDDGTSSRSLISVIFWLLVSGSDSKLLDGSFIYRSDLAVGPSTSARGVLGPRILAASLEKIYRSLTPDSFTSKSGHVFLSPPFFCFCSLIFVAFSLYFFEGKFFITCDIFTILRSQNHNNRLSTSLRLSFKIARET